MTAFFVKYHPQRSDETLALEKDGDSVIVNGQRFDFSQLEVGASLPQSAVDSPFFAGPVTRDDLCIRLNIVLPHGPDAPHFVLFPKERSYSDDGQMKTPVDLDTAP